MSIKIGSNNITNVYVGDKAVKEVYVGDTKVRPTSRLPSGFQEVEYIQSSGTQYFKVGSSFKTSYKVVVDLQMTVIGGDYVPIGVRNTKGYRYGIDVWGSYFTAIGGGNDQVGDNRTKMIAEDKKRHIISIDKNIATIDGDSYSIAYNSYTFNDGIGVFYYNRIGYTPVEEVISSNKLYKLDIYNENGKQIFDLVPSYRKSDNVIGMYDLVNSVFYTNNGTGKFIKGPNV